MLQEITVAAVEAEWIMMEGIMEEAEVMKTVMKADMRAEAKEDIPRRKEATKRRAESPERAKRKVRSLSESSWCYDELHVY